MACLMQVKCEIKFWRISMNKTISLTIFIVTFILSGCSNQMTDLGFPYSLDNNKEKKDD